MVMEFQHGYAFIMEGDTEKEFYHVFLEHLCKKHNAVLDRIVDIEDPDVSYILSMEGKKHIIKFNTVNAMTQIPRSGRWFNTQCVRKYASTLTWDVFLCYDRDDYANDVSKFYKGDWETLRNSLKRARNIVDMAASADIEDIMLGDIENICKYLGVEVPDSLSGRKGKAKMKRLFRDNGQIYHEGKRARPVIEALDMNKLIDKNVVPLKQIEIMMFEK